MINFFIIWSSRTTSPLKFQHDTSANIPREVTWSVSNNYCENIETHSSLFSFFDCQPNWLHVSSNLIPGLTHEKDYSKKTLICRLVQDTKMSPFWWGTNPPYPNQNQKLIIHSLLHWGSDKATSPHYIKLFPNYSEPLTCNKGSRLHFF